MPFSLSPKRFATAAFVLVACAVAVWLFVIPAGKPQDAVTESVSNSSSASSSNAADVLFPVDAAVAFGGNLVKRLSTTGIIRANREVELIASRQERSFSLRPKTVNL